MSDTAVPTPTGPEVHEKDHNKDNKDNKEIVKAFVEAWNTRDFDRFDRLMDADAVLRVGAAAVPCGPASTRAIAREWTTAFPDWHFDLLILIAEGDRVFAHMPYSGTHRAPVLGVAPTGRSCTVDEMVVFRLAHGRIAEAWEVYDEAGMWRQLGSAPPA
ncbi:ester cyclase [Kitasatospora sp. NPDC097691]|uniref:ester cyclase n=1 Tax=Kitasatospora sp. NPDC097691 TaxID=3157231 RepID=UPI00331B3D6F